MARNPGRDLATLQQQRAGLYNKLERDTAALEETGKAILELDDRIEAFDGGDVAVDAEAATATAKAGDE